MKMKALLIIVYTSLALSVVSLIGSLIKLFTLF